MSKDARRRDELAQLKRLLAEERAERQRLSLSHVALHQEREALHQEREALQQQCDALQRDREQLSKVVAECEATIERQQRSLVQQEHAMAQLLRRLCGSRQERIHPDQLLLFSDADLEALVRELKEDEGASEADAESQSQPTRRRGHGRRGLPADLPRQQVLHELSPAERACPSCGHEREEIGRETSEQLDYVPASLRVIEHVRLKYACRHCQEHVTIAAKPPQPVAKGLPGPGLLASTVLWKYGDHTPLYRQEDILSRHGVELRRSTLCGWTAAAAELAEPLYERMCRRVLQSRIVHTDDTGVKLLDPRLGHARTARFWAYIGDARNPYSVYDFTTSRESCRRWRPAVQ